MIYGVISLIWFVIECFEHRYWTEKRIIEFNKQPEVDWGEPKGTEIW